MKAAVVLWYSETKNWTCYDSSKLIVMSAFLSFAFVFLIAAKPYAWRCLATNESVSAANTPPPFISEDDLTSYSHLNTTEFGTMTLAYEPTMEQLLTYQASVELKRVYLPIIIVAGTFGNVLVVVIQHRLPPSQRSSMSVYFTALAVSDTTVLWIGWFQVLETFGATLSVEYHVHRDRSDVVVDVLCRIKVFLSYAFGEISAWILVFMTIHRALSIVWPHRTREVLTKRNTVKVVVFIFLFCVLSNVHVLYGHSLASVGAGQTAECFYSFVSERYRRFFNPVWLLVDMTMAVFLPFACLLVTNTVLIRKVGQSVREARESLIAGRNSAEQFASRDRKLSSMTLTLVIMSVAFLLLTSPVNFMYMVRTLAYGTVDDVRVRAASELALNAGMMLWFTNAGINFYLYCLTGTRYRAEFLRLFGCGGSAQPALPHTSKGLHQSKSSVNTTTATTTLRLPAPLTQSPRATPRKLEENRN